MSQKRILPILLFVVFVLALGLSIKLLSPKSDQGLVEQIVDEQTEPEQSALSPQSLQKPELKQAKDNATSIADEQNEVKVSLSQSLQDVKDGKTSIMSSILSGEDLNAQLAELLALSEAGEPWADYAIGQLAEMCTYLYETPETQLIEMFTSTRRGISDAQQAQFSELMPVVLDASKR